MAQTADGPQTLQLSIRIAIESPEAGWAPAERLTTCLAESGLWLGFDHVGAEGAPLHKVSSADELRAEFTNGTGAGVNVARIGADDLKEIGRETVLATRVEYGVVPWNTGTKALWSANLTLTVTGPEYTAAAPEAVERSLQFFERAGALGGLPPLSRIGLVAVRPVEFESVRPPRDPLWWQPALIHVADAKTISFTENRIRLCFERFLNATLPPGVERRRAGDLWIDVWSRDPMNRAQLERDVSNQQAWYAEALQLPIAPGFNPLGDEEVLAAGFESSAPPLTFYDTATKRGIVAVVPEEGDLTETSVAEPLHLLRARRLPDGRPLDRLDVLFPSRADAVALRPKAKALGFARTLYVANDKRMWNINPIRRWREPPTP